MADFVVDASIAAAWCFKDEATPYTEAVLDAITGPATAAAPRLFFYETHNLTLMGLRRQRVSQDDAEAFIRLLPALSIIITDPLAYSDVFRLAQHHRLTIYDAAYLELAIRKALPIASRDGDLLRAAGVENITVYQP